MRFSRHGWLGLLCLSLTANAFGQASTNRAPGDFGDLDLAQLAKIRIVSVSQRSEVLQNAPAAVRVVTGEEIARSGATSIPEALRAVPGLQVAQINGGAWAIGARGFQSQFSGKLLVLVDGVSVYTPLSGGAFWDEQNYFLPDLNQVEVVLGPGGSIWGANAVNGVINVITKSARDTQGGLVYAGGGSEKMALAGARYGWQVGTNTYARVYGMYDYNGPLGKFGGSGSAQDANSNGRGGFRLDGYPQAATEWTVKGEVRWGANDNFATVPVVPPPSNVFTNTAWSQIFGAQLMGHWQTEMSPDSTLQLQAYYDNAQRDTPIVNAQVNTVDLLLHHTWTGWQRQTIDWGLNARLVQIDTQPAWVAFDPASETDWLGSAFVQDEISLVNDRLFLTAGLKLEEHSTSGFMPQPNVRLTWHPAEAHTLWAAWSQAMRSPSKNDRSDREDLRVLLPGAPPYYSPLPIQYFHFGNPDVKPERLQAWEMGWRWQASSQLTLDVDSYYYQYTQLIAGTSDLIPDSTGVIPVAVENMGRSTEYGGDIAVTWRPTERWFATASYTLRHEVRGVDRPDPFKFKQSELAAPRQTAALTTGLKLCRQVELSGVLRYLDNVGFYHIPAYFELDSQLVWRPNDRWELALVGQNLLHDSHAEFKGSFGVDQSAELQRGVYAKLTWRF